MTRPFHACRLARWFSYSVATGILAVLPAIAGAQPNTGPARVVVATAVEGTITPTATFKGSVEFKDVADVATEVTGKVLEIHFDTGQHLEEGAVLVTLDAQLLNADRAAAAARAGQAEAELQLERVRMKRAEELLAEEVTTPQEFDNIRFTVRALEQRLEAARADTARLDRELEKKVIRTPFPGVIIQRSTELGEWLSTGDTVAVYARDAVYDVMVNLPEEHLAWSKVGDKVPLHIAGRDLEGEVRVSSPRGDTVTRTFPLRVRVVGEDWLMEGMSADVQLPVGENLTCLLLPRDAVLQTAAGPELVLAMDGKAVRRAARVIGSDDDSFGVEAEGLVAGSQVVTKGQERLRDGQEIAIEP